jgi:transcriptional regulator with AAA-type ATPase domain/tetratricopeptide (TPR) repeat protein
MTDQQHYLSQVRHLVDSQHFHEALVEIDRLPSLPPLVQAEANILKTKALLGVGKYELAPIDEALATLRAAGDVSLFPLAKYFRARVLILQSLLPDAQEELMEAYLYYKRLDDDRGMGRVANLQAVTSGQQSDFLSFFRFADRCLQHYKKGNFTAQIAMLLNNVALAHVRCGEYRIAQETLTEIANDYLSLLTEALLYNYYQSWALATAHVGKLKIAEEYLQRGFSLRKDLRREYFRQLEISGHVYTLAGEYARAEKYLLEGEKLAYEIAPDSTLVSQIKRLLGDLYIALGDYDLAFKHTSAGLAAAEKLNERIEIAACWRVLAQVEAHRGHAEKAREWFGKAIDLFSQISARYELAVTRYLAAVSSLYDPNQRVVMLYLAKEYFESEDIRPYIEKVGRELAGCDYPALRKRPAVKPDDGQPVTIVTVNEEMRRILDLAAQVAPSDMNVLLTGETGTGKDLLARYIHESSGRTGEFVSVNAAAVPHAMVESELFGYRKGAFTGADRDRPGLIEQADGGTLYLNEVADAPQEFQAKLLEVLETRFSRRLGENKTRRLSFRLIAATNHELGQRMKDNLFRRDLYHRLSEITIHLPSLAARLDDIPALVTHFLTCCGLDVHDRGVSVARLGDILARQSWPGNVRELRSRVRSLYLVSGGDIGRMLQIAQECGEESEEDTLARVLEKTGWNRSRAAELLGVSEGAVRKRIRKYGLNRD